MGICAGAGYSANAAINDRRIKALGMVSAAWPLPAPPVPAPR